MQIDEMDEQRENAAVPMHERFEAGWNDTFLRFLHALQDVQLEPKHSSQRCSSDEGLQMNASDEQPQNADFPIDES
jgi:hypothetical protein